MSPAHALRLSGAACLAACVAGAAAARPLSNAEFAEEVRTLRSTLAGSPAAVEQAARLCANLPTHRARDEPACVALQRHVRAAGEPRTAPGVSITLGPLTLSVKGTA